MLACEYNRLLARSDERRRFSQGINVFALMCVRTPSWKIKNFKVGRAGFVRVMENLESHGIWEFHFPEMKFIVYKVYSAIVFFVNEKARIVVLVHSFWKQKAKFRSWETSWKILEFYTLERSWKGFIIVICPNSPLFSYSKTSASKTEG